jgi:CheY-like chemotaxis protein
VAAARCAAYTALFIIGAFSLPALSVLYVEDNEDLRGTIGMLLEETGHEVVACADSEDALRLWAERDFDVVMTDVNLPGVSGMELTRLILAKKPSQWVILCSGFEFGAQIAQLGTNVRSLPKPFELEDLEALMGAIEAEVAARGSA